MASCPRRAGAHIYDPMAVVRPLLLLVLVASSGCAPDEEKSPEPPDPLADCAALGGSAPESVGDVVARLNALPEPRDVSCFVASLPRPLNVVATSSAFSLQPADGALSPRIFLVSDRLILSVVPRGPGSHYIELGEVVDDRRTVKGELAFPLEGPVADDAPYREIVDEERHCEFCHQGDTAHPTREFASVSLAFRPRDEGLVPLSMLQTIREGCDSAEGDGEHCPMLRALFDHGEVREGAFPATFPTFF
jgi:hypothetical protein